MLFAIMVAMMVPCASPFDETAYSRYAKIPHVARDVSTWECMGVGTRESAERRFQTCVFRDVVLTASGQLKLFITPSNDGKIGASDLDRLQLLAPAKMWNLNKGICLPYLRMRRGAVSRSQNPTGDTKDSPSVLKGNEDITVLHREDNSQESAPDDPRTCLTVLVTTHTSTQPDKRTFLGVYYDAFWPFNLGHFIYDDIFVSVAALADFGLLSTDATWIVRQPCAFIKHDHEWAMCQRRYKQWVPLLSNRTVMAVKKRRHTTSQGQVIEIGEAPDSETMFDMLVAGRPLNPFIHGMPGRATLWDVFSSQVLRSLQLTPHATQEVYEPRIVIANKSAPARRGFVNLDDMLDALRKLGVPVNVLTPGPHLTLQDELRIIREATLYITPCGGISMTATFMRRGTTVL